MSKITLQEMEFHAFHGCLEHEQKLGNTFLVTVSVDVNTELAGKSDQLTDTLNYQLIYNIVKQQMEIPSKLIEHLGERILAEIFNSFDQIECVKIHLSKLNPPLGGKVASVSIEMGETRNILSAKV